jgi:hypothetical protein
MRKRGEFGSYYSQQKPAFKEKLRARYAEQIVYFLFYFDDRENPASLPDFQRTKCTLSRTDCILPSL